MEVPRTHKDRGPQHGVERDVVLAHHVVVPAVPVLPPAFPRVGLAPLDRPLDRGRQIPDDRVEPHVDLLARVGLPTRQRDRHSPVQIARDGARLQVAHEFERILAYVRTPVIVRLDPLAEPLPKCGQVEEEELGLVELD